MIRHGEGFETSPAPNRNGSRKDHVMATKALPSPEVLRQLLRYEPETGKLFWLPRPRELCPSHRAWVAHVSQFSGKEALTSLDAHGYKTGAIFRVKVRAHRVAFAIFYGYWPTLLIDHINGDRADNRICNLRDVSNTANLRNAKTSVLNTSGVKGVYFVRTTGKWMASIRRGGKMRSLGHFADKNDAISARLAAVSDPLYLAGL